VRYRNAIDPKHYMSAPEGPAMTEERLDAQALLRERIMLGLRIAEGVDLSAAGRDLGVHPWTEERVRAVEMLEARGRIVREGDRLLIPKAAWLFADDTAARLF
jgi:oxygen-independent coproporphyrinogen-3 oxidase